MRFDNYARLDLPLLSLSALRAMIEGGNQKTVVSFEGSLHTYTHKTRNLFTVGDDCETLTRLPRRGEQRHAPALGYRVHAPGQRQLQVQRLQLLRRWRQQQPHPRLRGLPLAGHPADARGGRPGDRGHHRRWRDRHRRYRRHHPRRLRRHRRRVGVRAHRQGHLRGHDYRELPARGHHHRQPQPLGYHPPGHCLRGRCDGLKLGEDRLRPRYRPLHMGRHRPAHRPPRRAGRPLLPL